MTATIAAPPITPPVGTCASTSTSRAPMIRSTAPRTNIIFRVLLGLLRPPSFRRRGLMSWSREADPQLGSVPRSPENNASMPGVLKNAIDWVSRLSPQPFNERAGLLMSASPSMSGGNRGLWALRVPLEHLGARLYPDMFSLARAHQAFNSEGRIADAELQQRFDANVVNFMDQVEASTHYTCVKRAWVEYLGERPDPAIDRVE